MEFKLSTEKVWASVVSSSTFVYGFVMIHIVDQCQTHVSFVLWDSLPPSVFLIVVYIWLPSVPILSLMYVLTTANAN